MAKQNSKTSKFRIWAPEKKTMILKVIKPEEKCIAMEKNASGYFEVEVPNLSTEPQYLYSADGSAFLPDPASHFQPLGVHGPSQGVDHDSFQWTDQEWKGIALKDLILYELHTGTFTQEGTFEAIIPLLDHFLNLGVNAIEIMPVAQFPGTRNWGYDGVFPYAVQNSYGGPEGLKRLVNACHVKGICVFLDVVYNHLGPEGNYLEQFAPYFTDNYKTPWGRAINFDGPYCDGVRTFYCENALHWFQHYHIDGLRLDAIHAIYDSSAIHFWELLQDKVSIVRQQCGRPCYLIAESDLNDPSYVREVSAGGYGFDAQWLDDFHHTLLAQVDPKGKEFFPDFARWEQIAKAYKEGFVHTGEYVGFRKRKHGKSSAGIDGSKFVVFNMNHDQVGNRASGERLSILVDFPLLKLAAAAIILAPYLPMLFMGEEYGETAPFLYFVDHSDEDLKNSVRNGRKKEFEYLLWNSEPPDPSDERTFEESKLNWTLRQKADHSVLLNWHKQLIHLRKTFSPFKEFEKHQVNVDILPTGGFVLKRVSEGAAAYVLFNFSNEAVPYNFPDWYGKWEKILDSREDSWLGSLEQFSPSPANVWQRGLLEIPPTCVLVYFYKSDTREI